MVNQKPCVLKIITEQKQKQTRINFETERIGT